jgi:hypothetical protein
MNEKTNGSNEGLFRKEKKYGRYWYNRPSSIKFCDEENAILCEMAKHHEALRRGEANAES